MANISFGERLKRARVRAAMTQADLAEKMEVSQATISNWEISKLVPTREQKVQLKRILGGFSSDSPGNHSDQEVVAGPTPLSGWLTKARFEKNLSVSELAEMAGISAPAIYNIESGKILNPRSETVRRLEEALGKDLPRETKEEIKEEAKIEGLGELKDFNPHDDGDLPGMAGIYVLYDVSERPIYVGQGADMRVRLRRHHDKFWYKWPIVDRGAYVEIEEKSLREKVEKLLIRFLKSNAVINKQNVDRE